MPHLASFRLPVLFLAVVCCASSVPMWAQKDAGSIVGTIKDQTGATVPNAKVTVSDVERGIRLETTTNESGEYVAGPLRVGRYTVTVEHPGFKKSVTPPVDLDVQQRIALNVALQVGQISESIEVTAATPLLETETSELGQVVDNKRMANLPLNGRNFAQLALLTAGTAPSEPGARDEGGFGFSANGARSLQNNFLLDGVDNNSNLPDLLNETNYVIQPSVEAIEEFKVQTNAYSAEFGRGNGAIINATIKSGTNQFHGSAYEFLRNEKLDAKNFFDDPNSPICPLQAKPVWLYHWRTDRSQPHIFLRGLRRVADPAGADADFFCPHGGAAVRRFFRPTGFDQPATGFGGRPGDHDSRAGLRRASNVCGRNLQRASDPEQRDLCQRAVRSSLWTV